MSDDPTEHVQEHLTHEASHHAEHASIPRWITAAALTAAFLAAFAAVGGSLATSHLTESLHQRLKANDQWAFYQSKSVKNYSLESKDELLEALGHPRPAGDVQKIADNEAEKEFTKHEAKQLERLADAHLATHETYEWATTMFHIAIAMVAISVVAKRKEFWYLSMLLGFVGLFFFAAAFASAPPAEKESHPAAQIPASAPHTQ